MDVLQITDQREEKHRAWQRYMSIQKGSGYQKYVKAKTNARNETRKALRKGHIKTTEDVPT